ncbi:MAG: Asp-tRNA(Asn)/Glu-tRNA(Gln) amidotransferase subunit GatB [Clostridia bacterium]
MQNYEVIIGLEVHAQLATKTKIFCNCSTEFGADPNTHCCPICTGMPGTLPVLNEKVVEYAVKMGLATNCDIARVSKQDRKNYFYPDLPKAYQVTQCDLPLCQKGYVDISVDNVVKRIGITRIHIEEDAGKLIHDAYTGDTLVDMNRCSVPLIEIVSEPDIRNADEAVSYVQTLKAILEYLNICDCKMQEGSLRCDVNLSVRPIGQIEFGTRTETKNLNSFKSIQKCIEFETKRQIQELQNGGKIYQETRHFDDAKGIGYAMRTKENAQDYRYFPEPDLSRTILSDEYIQTIQNSLPELPNVRKQRYIKQYSLSNYDATQLTNSQSISKYFEDVVYLCNNPKTTVNFIIGDFFKMLNENEISIDESLLKADNLACLIKLIDNNTISSNIAKKVFIEMFQTGKSALDIVNDNNLNQITDEVSINEIVNKVLSDNPQSIIDYKAGRDRALGFLVGIVMKETKGRANPKIVNELLLNILNK